MVQAFFEKMKLHWMWEVRPSIYNAARFWLQWIDILAVVAIAGHNQNASKSDPAYLLGKITASQCCVV